MDPPTVHTDSGLKQIRHKTLSAYYPTLWTLQDYLNAQLGDPMVYHSDPEEYKRVLATTTCAPQRSAAPLTECEPEHIEGKQQEVIDRILQEVGKKGDRGDALVLGTKVGLSLSRLTIGIRSYSQCC